MSIRLVFLVLLFALGGCDRSVGRLSPGELPAVTNVEHSDLPFAAAAVDGRARELVVDRNWPGLSIAVGWRGEVVWSHAVGFADLEAPRPLTPESRIRIGPVTQALTATLAAILADEGVIDLDAPVGHYLPDLPAPYASLTTRALLRHVGGVRDHRGEGEFISGARHCGDMPARLALFVDDPLARPPGGPAAHSAYGLLLAAAAAEAAAGTTFQNLLRARVLEPLAMTRTGPAPAAGGQVLGDRGGPGQPRAADDAWLYWPFAATDTRYGLEHASQSDLSCVVPAEGLVATPSDLVKLGNALLDGGLVSPALLAALLAPPSRQATEASLIGLGFVGRKVAIGNRTVAVYSPPDARGPGWLGPGVPGGTAALVLVPEHGLVIAAATNVTFARELAEFTTDLAVTILDR